MPTITFHLDDEYEDELPDMLKYENVDSVEGLIRKKMFRYYGAKRFGKRLEAIADRMFPNGVQEPEENAE